MGLIDDIIVPSLDEENTKNFEAVKEWCDNNMPIYEASTNRCKEYFIDLQEAIYTVASYIINYEHAIESLDFSQKKLEEIIEKMSEITDETIVPIRDSLKEKIETNKEIANHLEGKKEDLKKILDILNEKSRQVVGKNDLLSRQYAWFTGRW